VRFEEELAHLLPADVPNRQRLIDLGAQHLRLITAANQYMNLTRITDARDAAIKHVYDSIAPWKYFANSELVLDAGTGAGFPGIPLAIILPHVRFILSESVRKKAIFVESVIEQLKLENAQVAAQRAEEIALSQPAMTITARAVAPIPRLIELFAKALDRGAHLLLYKGPDVEKELALMSRRHIRAEILWRYELPDSLGLRTFVQVQQSQRRGARSSS
jgi:16S rRNA (guanine527-N7)-methyltransferase